jgi:putative ABC transport system permease protein
MGAVRRFASRLVSLVRPHHHDAALAREVASHLTMLEEDYRRRGLSPAEAHRQARLALGGEDQTQEWSRDARTFRWLDDARRDGLYAMRMLRRRPLVAVTAVSSLAIGIGLNAAVFSVVDWVLLRPLPYPQPHQLVRVFTAGTAPVTGPSPVTAQEYARFGASTAFRSSAAYTTATRVVAGSAVDPAHVVIARVTGDLFATLGVVPEVGRGFSREEIAAGSPVVVVSQTLWHRQFAADRTIVGRVVRIDGVPHTVVGVMPARQGYPRDAEVWSPLTSREREDDDRELSMVARLHGETTPDRASAEMSTIASTSASGARTAWVEDAQRAEVGQVQAALRVLLAAALLTLLIACANVAALVGARGAERVGEMAVRSALGASRRRLFGQLITETVVLAILGGALGLLLGRWALPVLVTLAPSEVPRLPEIALDARIVGVGLTASVVAGVAVGVVPALRLSRWTAWSGLTRGGGPRIVSQARGRRVLVLVQVAIAVMLTVGAGLLTRSVRHLVTLDHGFAADRLLAVDLYLRGTVEGDARPLFRELMAASEGLPRVLSASVSMRLPTQLTGLRAPVGVVGEESLNTPAVLRPVTPRYFETIDVPVMEGRPFAATDGPRAPRVAIVNAAFVRDVLNGRAALATRVTTPLIDGPMAVVGVVGDVTPAGEPDRPALYVPVDQIAIGAGYLVVRTNGDPRSAMAALTARLRAVAPSLALDRTRRVAEALEQSRGVTRFAMQLANLFAALAVVLAMIGIYGLTAGEVTARWRELAVRLALGASRRDALWTVLRPCGIVLMTGAALGLVGAISIGPTLASQLHGVGPRDAVTLLITPLLMGLVGVVAAVVAGSRVLRADPAATLRSE